MSKPASVYLWSNRMVMVFDCHGQQIPDLQGRLSEVREKVLAAATDQTQFYGGYYRWGTWPIPRREFETAVGEAMDPVQHAGTGRLPVPDDSSEL